jgi:CMP-N-acetylneuraminic acid synthetase/mannose-6-phosphate isomerase-like protein (cupin superfamily)
MERKRIMKVVAMIPARYGSKRIPKKNVRLLNGIPLISHIIRATKDAECFDEIYVNSESGIIGTIAKEEGVKFYKRPNELSTDSATNDQFTEDFLQNIECDVIVQILPTSPFITPEIIKEFTDTMVEQKADTLISVSNQQIECVYQGRSINFEQKKVSPPSQDVEPVQAYACGLMAWRKDNYLENMKKYDCGYHGGDGDVGCFVLSGHSTIDIDDERDFQLAEFIARTKNKTYTPQYYGDYHIEVDVPAILAQDGVTTNNLHDTNKEIVNVNDIRASFDNSVSWSHRVVNTENNSATLIHQQPGEGNRTHYHPDWNEWWFIVDGEWIWEIEGVKKIIKKDDVVFIPKGVKHRIEATGDKPAIRLAVSREDVAHVYPDGEHTNEK